MSNSDTINPEIQSAQIQLVSDRLVDPLDRMYPDADMFGSTERVVQTVNTIMAGPQLEFAAAIRLPFAWAYQPENRDKELAANIRSELAATITVDDRGNRTDTSGIELRTARYSIAMESDAPDLKLVSREWQDDVSEKLHTIISGPLEPGEASGLKREMSRIYQINDDTEIRTIAREVLNCVEQPHANITSNVLKFHAGIEIEAITKALGKYNLDSFKRYAAELVDNIRHKHPNGSAARWREIQTALHFVAPAIRIFGDNKTGEWLRNEALIALHEADTDLIDVATKHHKNAKELHESGFSAGIEEVVETALADKFGILFEADVKSVGATAEKIKNRQKTARVFSQPNDMLRYRVILVENPDGSETITDENWIQASELLRAKFQTLGIAAKGDQEIYLGKNTKPSGYKSIHNDFEVSTNNGIVNIELQVVTAKAHYINQVIASPVLQKARTGMNRIPTLLRKSDAKRKAFLARIGTHKPLSQAEVDFTSDDQVALDEFYNELKGFRTRASKLGRRIIKPRSLAKAAVVDEFAQADQLVLGPIHDMDVMGKKSVELNATIPSVRITREQFLALTEELFPDIVKQESLRKTLELVFDLHGEVPRKLSEDVKYVEGHLLGVAIGLMYKLAKKPELVNEEDHLAIACAALLHDFKEDIGKILEDDPEFANELWQRYYELVEQPGMEKVDEIVSIVTKPTDEEVLQRLQKGAIPIHGIPAKQLIEDLRATMAVDKVAKSGNTLAQLLKLMDRSQNIHCDIVRMKQMITGEREFTEDELGDILKFRQKTQYLFDNMDLEEFAPEVTWLMATFDAHLDEIERRFLTTS